MRKLFIPQINMKRHGNIFNKIIERDNIYLAYRKARKGKGWQDTVKRFECELDENIIKIQELLINKTYTTSNYTQRTIYEPKERLIYKLPFNPDRIIQHAIMNIIEPIWDKLMIHDSYSCRKGKGIHAASKQTCEFIRQVNPGYCLKMDIRKFYPSINHDIMFNIVQQKIKCEDTLDLFEDVIYSIPDGKNIPIGNYTSQWLGNLYMNELDMFVKHTLHFKHYIRYCDDFIFLHKDKKYLHEIRDAVTEFIDNKLDMSLSKNDIFPISHGIDFVGYRHFHKYILVRKSTAKRVKQRLQDLPKRLSTNQITKDQYRSTIASTLGWLQWANSYNFRKNIGINILWEKLNVAG